jgi:hypothetical protein
MKHDMMMPLRGHLPSVHFNFLTLTAKQAPKKSKADTELAEFNTDQKMSFKIYL